MSEQIRAAVQADVPEMAGLAAIRREQYAATSHGSGGRLLRAGLTQAGQRGAVQAVVVTAHLDQSKRRALRACGLEVASEWWVTPQALVPGPGQDTDRH